MQRKSHEELVKTALSRPRVKREYEAMEEEFAILSELLKARLRAGKTQEQVAKTMGTSTSVVGRLETAGGKHMHSPTLTTLQNYAHAVNCTLKIRLVPIHH
jgi:DNA-binding XRE family transcriptional regulator